jgi:hypothetical protein
MSAGQRPTATVAVEVDADADAVGAAETEVDAIGVATDALASGALGVASGRATGVMFAPVQEATTTLGATIAKTRRTHLEATDGIDTSRHAVRGLARAPLGSVRLG